MNETMQLGDILGKRLLKKAVDLANTTPADKWTNTFYEQVTKPHLEEINQRTGQENDAMYLAYAITYVFQTAAQRQGAVLH
jgi:hypothetical protein